MITRPDRPKRKRFDPFGACRKLYFSLWRDTRQDEDARHSFNEATTGRASCQDWTGDDWHAAITELWIRSGRDVADLELPHVWDPADIAREDDGDGRLATQPQINMIRAQELGIRWDKPGGLVSWTRVRVLGPVRGQAWSGQLRDLARGEATSIITALKRMPSRSAGEPAGAPKQPTTGCARAAEG